MPMKLLTTSDNSHDFELVAVLDLTGGEFRRGDGITVVFDRDAFRKEPVGGEEIDQGTGRRQLQGFAIGGDGWHWRSMRWERNGGNRPGKVSNDPPRAAALWTAFVLYRFWLINLRSPPRILGRLPFSSRFQSAKGLAVLRTANLLRWVGVGLV